VVLENCYTEQVVDVPLRGERSSHEGWSLRCPRSGPRQGTDISWFGDAHQVRRKKKSRNTCKDSENKCGIWIHWGIYSNLINIIWEHTVQSSATSSILHQPKTQKSSCPFFIKVIYIHHPLSLKITPYKCKQASWCGYFVRGSRVIHWVRKSWSLNKITLFL